MSTDEDRVLADLSLKSVAEYLDSDVCRNKVFIMECFPINLFAISTNQFHEQGSLLAPASPTFDLLTPANLAKLNLPYPEAVFDIEYFQRHPQPFYTLAKDVAPGKFIPTPTHAFIRLLHEKGRLHTCYTQNIDTLERLVGVPSDKIIEAHGSFASQRCISCKTPYNDEKMKAAINEGRVPRCEQKKCNGLVKPDIVFFGESLPPEFITSIPALRSAALVIIIGTSLKVHPFARLPTLVPPNCPRLLLNLEPAGMIGERTNDVVHLGQCDSAVRKLCDILGWRDELEVIWKRAGGGSKDKKQSKNGKNVGNTVNVRNTTDAGGSSEDTAKNLQQEKAEDKSTEENNVEKTLERVVEDIKQTLVISPKSEEGGTVENPPVNVHDDQEHVVEGASGGLEDQERKNGTDETKENIKDSSGSKSTAQVPDLVQGEVVSASTLNQMVPDHLE